MNNLSLYFKKLQAVVYQQPKYFDHYQIALMFMVIISLSGFFFQSLSKPIGIDQKQEIQLFTEQQLYPDTKELAESLVHKKTHITQADYYRLLRVMHVEQRRIRYQKNEEEE